jgi:hypothetical protein
MAALVFLLVLTSGTINVYNSYGSARTLEPNSQTTQTELTGTQWFVQSANKNVTTIVTNTQLSRFIDFICGTEGLGNSWLLDNRSIPSHFGYEINSSAFERFGAQERYMVVDQEDRDMWEWIADGLPALAPVYSPGDFDKLHSDSSVSKIFSNGGLDVYRVGGN